MCFVSVFVREVCFVRCATFGAVAVTTAPHPVERFASGGRGSICQVKKKSYNNQS